MGVNERKERHKEDLKKEILAAAQQLFVERGLEATSIRNIAEKIEYSPATIYLYYKDKNDIIHALHQEGFKQLTKHFQESIQNVSDPFEQLLTIGRAYIQFAIKHEDIYNLLFITKEPLEHVERSLNEEWGEGEDAFGLLVNLINACQQTGYFKGMDVNNLSFMVWSTMHGLCALRVSGHLAHVCVKKSDLPLDAQTDAVFETFALMLKRMKN
jgi:AcrR family transcriptional regulator